jgi:hypothetical protein
VFRVYLLRIASATLYAFTPFPASAEGERREARVEGPLDARLSSALDRVEFSTPLGDPRDLDASTVLWFAEQGMHGFRGLAA